MRSRESSDLNEEIIVRSLKQPTCSKVEIDGNKINYIVEKELGIELVGDIKVKIEANLEEEPWDEIVEDKSYDEKVNDIDKEIKDDFIKDKDLI